MPSPDDNTAASEETSVRNDSSAALKPSPGVGIAGGRPDTEGSSLDGEGFIGSVQRYTALILGMILCGIVMSMALGSMVSWRGVPGPVLSQAITPIWAILMVLGCLLVCLVIAVGVAKIVNPAVGMFVLGSGLGALSMGSGGYPDILFGETGGIAIGLETLVWGVVVLIMAAVIHRLTGPLPDQPRASEAEAFCPREVFSPRALRGAAAGALAIIAVTLFAGNDLAGQALAAAIIAGVATGYVGRVLAPEVQPVLLYAAPCVFLALGQAMIMGGGTADVIPEWMRSGGPRLVVPTPIDVAAGAMMGVSIGIGFSRGFVEANETS